MEIKLHNLFLTFIASNTTRVHQMLYHSFYLRSSLFRDFTQHKEVIPYRHFGTTSVPSSRVKKSETPHWVIYQNSAHLIYTVAEAWNRFTYLLHFFFYVLLTVHLSIFISVINQLDALNFFYNKFIIRLYMFRAPCAYRQEVKIVSYSLWYHHTCRWLSAARDGHLQVWW